MTTHPTTVPEPMTGTGPALTLDGLIGYTLRVRSSTTRGAPADAAALRAGLSPATETYALSRTELYLTGLPLAARIGARRAAGICAAATNAPQTGDTKQHWKVGDSIRALYDRENPGRDISKDPGYGIVQSVSALPMLDVEAAAATMAMLIQRCSHRGIAVNYYDLARTLSYWGNGISPRSVQTRQRVVSSFYQHTTRPATAASPVTKEQS